MARSKRNKIVSLTKTGAKGKTLKSKLIEVIRGHVDEYKSIYVFSFENLRTSKFRDVRMDWKESKIYMGKNAVSQVALGRTVEEEYKDNLRHVSKLLEGNVGLLFTSRPQEEVEAYFSEFSVAEFAKAGTVPTESMALEAGPLPFPISMMGELRKMGMVVEVQEGKLVLRDTMTIAFADVPLTPEQAKILTKLDVKLIDFRIKLISRWENGAYQEY